MMKAARINQCGGLDVLEYGDFPFPEVGPFDVLVKVMATSVSGWDIKYRNGDLFAKFENKGLPGRAAFPLPQQLGREATGEVVEVGEHVRAFSAGDRVLGLVHPENPSDLNAVRGLGNLSVGIDYPGHAMKGGNAQYVSRPEHYWMKLPDNVSYEAAAAGSWSYPTSHRIVVDRCNVRPGDVVFVTGASGGMGYATLEWARLSGASVITTSRSEKKRQALYELGADLVVDPANITSALEQILQFTRGQGVEHSIEFTGNPDLLDLSFSALRLGGTICPVGGDVQRGPLPWSIMDLVSKEMNVVGIRGSRLNDQRVFLEALSRGLIKPQIACELPLREIREAHRLVENHEVLGKVILKPWL
ncbi:zinc-binding alcohol dehydrogenase family protein [Rhodobacteraceae bacterium RKSG542]|uniref:quinone oxidoreductase family protein n=1 Tax=Pseudovibrio flavus TaxID=2529854 RepID=UPI0012BB8ADA|nr:zinc-binding dehydrogenase [Pseudovibrio flavus]MTI16519.1 zinc-binding alcohol dehydrogenase family protein [Pseudovibrio flavus]